jgi:hypothetical protein
LRCASRNKPGTKNISNSNQWSSHFGDYADQFVRLLEDIRRFEKAVRRLGGDAAHSGKAAAAASIARVASSRFPFGTVAKTSPLYGL